MYQAGTTVASPLVRTTTCVPCVPPIICMPGAKAPFEQPYSKATPEHPFKPILRNIFTPIFWKKQMKIAVGVGHTWDTLPNQSTCAQSEGRVSCSANHTPLSRFKPIGKNKGELQRTAHSHDMKDTGAAGTGCGVHVKGVYDSVFAAQFAEKALCTA